MVSGGFSDRAHFDRTTRPRAGTAGRLMPAMGSAMNSFSMGTSFSAASHHIVRLAHTTLVAAFAAAWFVTTRARRLSCCCVSRLLLIGNLRRGG